ncbi:MAG: hypothetical protein ABIU54_14800, partial [Candidatus Eisenbacteria bacterium]
LVQEGMGGLTLARAGGTPRRLFHQGGHAFHPAGAPMVGVRFESAAGGMTVQVTDGDQTVMATRSGRK